MGQVFNKIQWKLNHKPRFQTNNEIHVWLIPVDPTVSPFHYLSDQEKKIASSYKNEKTQQIYRASRSAMRNLFSQYLDCPLSLIQYDKQKSGKPFIKQPVNYLEFNLTHSEHLVLLAISNKSKVGIDTEIYKLVKNWEKIAHKMFDSFMIKTLEQSDTPEKTFIQLWTEFEAKQKLQGKGIFNTQTKCNATSYLQFHPIEQAICTLAYQNKTQPNLQFYRYVDNNRRTY